MKDLKVNFELFNKEIDTRLPQCATKQSVGYDLFTTTRVYLPPGEITKVPLNLKWAPNYPIMGKVFEKSGLSLENMHVLAGVVEADYHEEWAVIVFNASNIPILVAKHRAIAQVVFSEVLRPADLVILDKTRTGGYGSTGA